MLNCWVHNPLVTVIRSIIVFLRHKVQTSQKKLQGNVFLLNWKAHAKIPALLKEKKIHPKKSLTSVLHQAIQLYKAIPLCYR